MAAIQREFALHIPKSWSERIDFADPRDPLGMQVIPHPDELADPEGSDDPVGEEGKKPHPLVVQKHPDRAVFLVTKACFLHCRYCFRRRSEPELSEAALDEAAAWIRAAQLHEVIFSGGDPLALPDARLFALMDAVAPAAIRVHTRGPVAAPVRITPALAQGLAARRAWVVVSINHPAELGPAEDEALARLADAGVPLLNQSVLLRGINDRVEVLEALSHALVARRVFPYYLHHTDAVSGNQHLRVSLEEGAEIYRALAPRLSGLALPRYVIDPPDGSGKVDVERYLLGNRS